MVPFSDGFETTIILYLPETAFHWCSLGQCLKHSYVLPHKSEDSSLNSRRGCPLRLCSLHPHRLLRPHWVMPWATASELTAEPAWSNMCGSGYFNSMLCLWVCLRAEDGRVAGSSVWFFTTAAVPASGKEKMSCFKHLTGSSFSTLGDLKNYYFLSCICISSIFSKSSGPNIYAHSPGQWPH